jgi:hypothetical protein
MSGEAPVNAGGPVDIGETLIEEFEQVGPHWLRRADGSRCRRIDEIYANLSELPPDLRPTALCLSGGGIRSATFSLGVLQSFARTGRLHRFDYLSSVSGGGYIASWLHAWLRRERTKAGTVEAALADAVSARGDPAAATTGATLRPRAEADAGRDPLSRLRAYSNYLSPVGGLSSDALALVAIFLRNLLLNQSVWLPLLCTVVLLPRLYIAALTTTAGDSPWALVTAGLVAGGLVVLAIAYTVADLPNDASSGAEMPPAECRSWFALFGFAPLLAAAIAFSLYGAWLPQAPPFEDLPWYAAAGVGAHLLGILVGVPLRKKRGLAPRHGASGIGGAVAVVLIGAVGGALLWLAFQLRPRGVASDGLSPLLWATGAVPLVLAAYWVALSLYAGLLRRVSGEEEREWWSRATGSWLAASLGWVAAFGVLLHLPLWLLTVSGSALPSGAQLGVGGTLLGMATAAAGYWSANGAKLKHRAKGLINALGARVLELVAAAVIVILLLLLSLAAGRAFETCNRWSVTARVCVADLAAEADQVRQQAMLDGLGAKPSEAPSGEALAFALVLERSSPWPILLLLVVLLAIALSMSLAIGANAFSLHAMYGNRLVRAYLGATRARRRPHWFTGFDPDDNLPLHDEGPAPGSCAWPPVRPFHVVNIALNLVAPSDRRLAWQQRKAASFTATPLRCGADPLGYLRTEAFGGRQGMSLGRAMTISGAAASPNMGYHSSPLVTFVMTLFNVRLGWWMPNPGDAGRHHWNEDEPRLTIAALLSEAMGRTTDTRASIHLSDGGHFENLGLYEMVRRRCHRIVVVDASCDPKFEYADLLDSVRKIRVDFGIPIDLPAVLPGPGRQTPDPRLVVARIGYSARDGGGDAADGWLYLLKPRLDGTEPPQLTHYATHDGGGKASFPHQSTADQFYDETQFECYRLLGLLTADRSFRSNPWTEPQLAWPAEPEQIIDRGPTQQEASGGTAGDRDAGVVPPPWSADGLLGSLQHLGGGAALATALTVGGTVGVVGTVAMSPGEVRLSAEDRTLLKDGLQVRVAGGELKFSDADRSRFDQGLRIDTSTLTELLPSARAAVAALQRAADSLQEATARLDPAAGRPGGAGGGGTGDGGAVMKTVVDLQQSIRRLTVRLEQPLTVAPDPRIPTLVENVNELVLALKTRQDLAPLTRQIEDVTRALKELKDSVDKSSPRSNVRGQEGGTR